MSVFFSIVGNGDFDENDIILFLILDLEEIMFDYVICEIYFDNL